MCGVAGIISLKNSAAETDRVKIMTDCMAHRGPDAGECFSANGIALGHRRLSIIDLSDAANQPFHDQSERYTIVFNGEIYNYQEVKKELTEYTFRTNGDTEVILAAYLTWGESAVTKLKGMFSFAIWDAEKQNLFIARDRMGVKPLYYFRDENYFIFASEIRAILASGLVPRRLNKKAVQEYFHYQSIGNEHTIIENIFQLEAACSMVVDKNGSQVKKYWNILDARKQEMEGEDRGTLYKKVRTLLTSAVERRLVSDVPVGAFLSGGIDSSVVVGLMAEAGNTAPNTFTIGFDEPEFDESEYAAIIAKKFNTHHTNVRLKPSDFLDELFPALDSLDTPSGDGINTYTVSKAIRKTGLRVALSGVGGDELFAGYPFFKQYLNLRKLKSAWPLLKPVRAAGGLALKLKSSNKTERIASILRSDNCSVDQFYPEFRRILAPSILAELTTFEERDYVDLMETRLRRNRSKIEAFPDLSQVSIAEYLGYTQNTLLKDTDQMSMAVSLEVREPFFDHDLIEYVLGIPDNIKFPAYPKKLMIESVIDLLPPEIIHRPKKGFLFPWKVWMKGPLQSFCQQQIDSISKRDFVKAVNLQKYWQRFLSGDPSVNWSDIWLFVILEHWLNKNQVEA